MEPRYKFVLAISCLFLAISIISNANAINVGVGTHLSPSGLNTQYTVNSTLTLTSIRVESTALYFNGNILKYTPDAGSITVYLDVYNPPNDIKYMINTTGATTEVNHTIGGLNATEKYSILVDGAFWKAQSTNATGVLMFNHSASNHTFEITKSANVICDQHIYNCDGNAVSYKWGNWSANPGDTHVGNYSDTSQTFIKATNNGSADGTATLSWNAGYFLNGANQIDISNNIRYVYGVANSPKNASDASPEWADDPDGVYSAIDKTYNDNTSDGASTNYANHYIVWYLNSSISCNNVRLYACDYDGSNRLDANVTVDVYYSGAWHNIYNGTITHDTWNDLPIGSTQVVTQARMKFNSITLIGLVSEFKFGSFNWIFSAVDSDYTFQVTVPAQSTLWLYYEIQNIGAVPSGTYTQSFTWTAT